MSHVSEESGRFVGREPWALSCRVPGSPPRDERNKYMRWEQYVGQLDTRAVVRSTDCSGRKEPMVSGEGVVGCGPGSRMPC